jgi:hypothetical protein
MAGDPPTRWHVRNRPQMHERPCRGITRDRRGREREGGREGQGEGEGEGNGKGQDASAHVPREMIQTRSYERRLTRWVSVR